MKQICISSPIGPLTLVSNGSAITGVTWGECESDDSTPELDEAAQQITEYFEGKRTTFDLPLSVEATDFQQAACDAMLAIPFGETRTYGEIAEQLNAPAQAVGAACGGNPIPVIIPCHRVLGASSLGGYSGQGRDRDQGLVASPRRRGGPVDLRFKFLAVFEKSAG